ncbi:hypothetical protein Brsp05_04173 [Brucella sp. NBRC 12953]
MRPEITRNIDLRRRTAAPCLLDDTVEHFRDTGWIADLFLIADHILEQCHLFHFLEAALTNGLVGRLRRYQQHWCVVPIGSFDRGHKASHTWPILGNGHAHLACHARIAVADQGRIGLVRAIPEGDARLGKQVGNRHHRRPDNPKCMFNSMHLQDLYERFLRRHLHFSGTS